MELRIEDINRLDAEAFHQLYKMFYKALVYYGWQITDSKETAEDIVQELFSSIWEKQLQFQSIASFRSYLYNAVRNAALNHLKHRDVENSYLERLAGSYEDEAGDEREDEFDEEEIYQLLFQTIDRLPERCREVFLMYMDGKKNEEIAQALSISLETVKTQKKRAMQVLRKNLGIYSLLLVEILCS